MGIRLREMPPIIRPEERIQHVTIPGRSGELTLAEGEDIYNSYIQTIPLAVKTEAAVRSVESWLRGSGTVTFSCQPDMQQAARVINAVTFTKHGRNSVWWDGEVQFYCNPIKYLISEAALEISESGTTITNDGDMTSFPLITLHGTGTFTATVRCGGNTLTVPGATDGLVIDCENKWITRNGVPIMNACSGNFPVITAGDNGITFTGASSLTVAPRSRYI
jgi:phage-related protein